VAREVEHLERALVVQGGILVRKLRRGAPRRPFRVVDRLLALPTRRRLDEVVGQLGDRGIGIGPVQLLQRLADPPVHLDPPRTGELRVQRLPDERVRERVAPPRAARL
jgi:hypothetical protein